MSEVGRALHISRPTVANWKEKFRWDERCAERDDTVKTEVDAVVMPEWVAVKVALVRAFLDQINASIKLGIVPTNSREMCAVSKELRALMGDSEAQQIEFAGIEYHLVSNADENR